MNRSDTFLLTSLLPTLYEHDGNIGYNHTLIKFWSLSYLSTPLFSIIYFILFCFIISQLYFLLFSTSFLHFFLFFLFFRFSLSAWFYLGICSPLRYKNRWKLPKKKWTILSWPKGVWCKTRGSHLSLPHSWVPVALIAEHKKKSEITCVVNESIDWELVAIRKKKKNQEYKQLTWK